MSLKYLNVMSHCKQTISSNSNGVFWESVFLVTNIILHPLQHRDHGMVLLVSWTWWLLSKWNQQDIYIHTYSRHPKLAYLLFPYSLLPHLAIRKFSQSASKPVYKIWRKKSEPFWAASYIAALPLVRKGSRILISNVIQNSFEVAFIHAQKNRASHQHWSQRYDITELYA